MQSYPGEAAALIGEAMTALKRLDELTSRELVHRLDPLAPLIMRLEHIHSELVAGRLAGATRGTHDLTVRLLGRVVEFEDPAYRSALASALAQYSHKPKPRHSKLGGLKGGRPRKDGQPVRTMESKGYSADVLPPPKSKGMRSHPEVRKYLRSLQVDKA
jgi:hypothetical protein